MGHHDLNWYEQMAATVAEEVRLAFGVDLNFKEKTDIRDAIYRIAVDGALRQAQKA